MDIKRFLNSWLSWVFGVLLAVFVKSLWENGEVDWGKFVTLSIGGLIGIVFCLGIKKFIKNAYSERQN